MITLLIVAAIWINAYLENLCHMDRSTDTTYAFFKRWNIYRNLESVQYSLEFSKLHWKDKMQTHQNPVPVESRQPIF